MHGPVDHLHPALAELGAEYVVNTVAVRPGFPMLLATLARPGRPPRPPGGLPGNPQSAVVALCPWSPRRSPAGPAGRRPDRRLPRVRARGAGARPGRRHPPRAGAPRRPDGLPRRCRTPARRCCAGSPARSVSRSSPRRAPAPPATRSPSCPYRCCQGRPVIVAVTTDRSTWPRTSARSPTPDAGAVVSFAGVVRDHDHGRVVLRLEYEAHPSAEACSRRSPPRSPPTRRCCGRRSPTGSARWRSATWRWSPRSPPPTARRPSRLRPPGRRGQGPATDLEAPVLRRRHGRVGELSLTPAGRSPDLVRAGTAEPGRLASRPVSTPVDDARPAVIRQLCA